MLFLVLASDLNTLSINNEIIKFADDEIFLKRFSNGCFFQFK